MASIEPKLEQLALKIGGDIFECRCFKEVEVSVIYSKGKGQKFEGNREIFLFEPNDTIQILISKDQLAYLVDSDTDKLVRTISKVGANKLKDAMRAKKLKSFSIEDLDDEDKLEGKYRYFIATPFKDSKSFGDYVTIKKWRSPKEGLFGEITYNQLLQPKEMVRLELVNDEKRNKKQSYDLGNGADTLDKEGLKNKLVAIQIRDKDDLYFASSKMYNNMNAAKQYFIDDKYLMNEAMNELDIISLARLYIDLETLEKL